MKKLSVFLLEEQDKTKDPKIDLIPDIKWTVWDDDQKRIYNVNDVNQNYNKIEYLYIDKKKNIKIQFLMGLLDDSWHIWIGKVGGTYYSDEPYCNLKARDFKTAVIKSLDTVATFIINVKNNPDSYQNYYLYI